MAAEEESAIRIVIIGNSGSGRVMAAAIAQGIGVVTVYSIEELNELQGNQSEIDLLMESAPDITQPEILTVISERKYRSGKGRGRGSADWNKRNRGY